MTQSNTLIDLAQSSVKKLSLWRSFYFQLALRLVLCLLLFTAVVGFVYFKVGYQSDLQFLKQRILGIVDLVSRSVPVQPLVEYDASSDGEIPLHAELAKYFLSVTQIDSDISSIYVLLPSTEPGQLLFFYDYSTEPPVAEVGQIYDATELPIMLKAFDGAIVEPRPYEDIYGLSLSAYAPLKDSEGNSIALVGVDVDISRLNILKKRIMGLALTLCGIAAVMIVLMSIFIGLSVRKPLLELLGAFHTVARGNLTAEVCMSRKDEFGVLSKGFTKMVSDLRDREMLREMFGLYVSKKIANALLQKGCVPDLGGEERVVTILFSDLRNYTKISEQLSPQQLVDMLNQYFGVMNEVIDRHGGCVIEFLGDAILAVFGTPCYTQEHAEQAVQCACSMRQQLAKLNEQWESNGLASLWSDCVPRIQMRIGIHTGPVVAGNLGSYTRMKYAVIGDTVNVAARLETLNNQLGTNILMSEEVKTRLPPYFNEALESCGAHTVKGRNEQVTTYTLKSSAVGFQVDLTKERSTTYAEAEQ